MREITTHKVNGLNDSINIIVMDEPGSGGANHHYRVEPITESHPQGAINPFDVKFQNGPIKDAGGVNGVSNEALLAIVIDRLRSFQNGGPGELQLTARGPFACRENAIALTKLEEAMHWLHHRTRARLARGVEGTHEK